MSVADRIREELCKIDAVIAHLERRAKECPESHAVHTNLRTMRRLRGEVRNELTAAMKDERQRELAAVGSGGRQHVPA